MCGYTIWTIYVFFYTSTQHQVKRIVELFMSTTMSTCVHVVKSKPQWHTSLRWVQWFCLFIGISLYNLILVLVSVSLMFLFRAPLWITKLRTWWTNLALCYACIQTLFLVLLNRHSHGYIYSIICLSASLLSPSYKSQVCLVFTRRRRVSGSILLLMSNHKRAYITWSWQNFSFTFTWKYCMNKSMIYTIYSLDGVTSMIWLYSFVE